METEIILERVTLVSADSGALLGKYPVDLPNGGKGYKEFRVPGRDKEHPEKLCGEIIGYKVFQGGIQIGWLIRVRHSRTWKWHAVRDLPILASNGWYRNEDLPVGRKTIREAVKDLIPESTLIFRTVDRVYGVTEYRLVSKKLHRVNGPAVEYSDGTKEWWINGLEIAAKTD